MHVAKEGLLLLQYQPLFQQGKEMKTMSETYGEPNDRYGKHLCCPKCGLCITCGDCKCEKESRKNLKL